ncbi:hypothetical protein E4A47_01090 [Micrococcus flavus]|uniref:Uncharacterized protein n=1 Tax=Micrococcus flavus TaxID=384602 RepID=A0A4Y8X420_9MICC|nr:hypothetical protein [Micrococcus flavus]MBB4882839.1 hypothetical protein [Micrococcus flavus]TFI04281.1 hypothetical protein E4A47_01090 [Micrococcus flavus]GGK40515.1 hypothetical protein GCM10007073_04160 [Micrococcus flavus]
MTTPHGSEGADREDELLRAVLAEETAADEAEHGRRDPISPAARARLRSGTAAPTPRQRPSVDDVDGRVDRARSVPETTAPGAVIGDEAAAPEPTSSAQVFIGADAETPDLARTWRHRPRLAGTPATAAEPPAEPEAAPEEARIDRRVEAFSPWTRLHSPQDDADSVSLVPSPRPAAATQGDAVAPAAPVTAPPARDGEPAGAGSRNRALLLLGALVLLALLVAVLVAALT